MGAMTDYTEEKFLKHFLGATALTMPTTVYLAMHTADPTESGASSEATGGSYARQACAMTWNSGSVRAENTSNVIFPAMPAGTFSHWSLKDAASGGNSLFYGAVTTPATLSAGDYLRVLAGTLRITAD